METNKLLKKANSRLLIITCLTILVVIVAAIVATTLLFSTAQKSGKLYITRDTSQQTVLDSIESKCGSSFSTAIKLLSNIRDINRKGYYEIEEGTTALDAWRMLSSGAQTPIKFTFNNIRTLDNFAENADKSLEMTKEEIMAEMLDPDVLKKYGFNKETLPAMLMPDTYFVYWTITPKQLLKKLNDAYNAFWNESNKNKAAKLSLNPIEVTTLASIVEEETAYGPEKGTVARLYLNRLHKGMKLQSDPTVKFAVGDESLKWILKQHLLTESPYNTYMVFGLPPGPIRMPMKSTINAVLNAPQNDYLYMCAKEDFSGSHNFTSNYATHMSNARRYQAALNARGIK